MKALRKKFILVAMASVFVVLAAIMTIINIANYLKITKRADEILSVIEKDEGRFHISLKEEGKELWEGEGKPAVKNFSPETPFETRFFTVKLNQDGEADFCDLRKIAAVSEEEAVSYAKKVSVGSSEKGFIDVYRYRKTKKASETQIIFLDCRKDIATFWSFLVNGIIVSGFGMMAVLILVIIFSRIIFLPVVESYEKQKQFVTDASHEIKTPLTIIDANIEVIEMENGVSQWTKSSKNQIQRLSVLTRQLTDLARLDEEDPLLQKEEFSISDAVFESVRPFEALAKTTNRNMCLNIQDQLLYCGDEKSIRQMINILVDNAVKYSTEESIINIFLHKTGKKIILEVSNQTEGIPQGNLDKIFERFYRLDSSRNSGKGGSGIGLSLAQAIVKSHKGTIHANSCDGKEMKITLTL